MNIVIFGDSNVWGYDPQSALQRPDRFVCRLGSLHPEWKIESFGQNGRLMSCTDPFLRSIDGSAALSRTLQSALPFDLLIILLGSNDARRMFHQSLKGWMESFETLITQTVSVRNQVEQKTGIRPAVLFVSPFPVPDEMKNDPAVLTSLGEGGRQILAECAQAMKERIEREEGIRLLDSAKAGIFAGKVDGIHLDSRGHAALARLLSRTAETICFQNPESAVQKILLKEGELEQ